MLSNLQYDHKGKDMKREISKIGVFFTIVAFIIFTGLTSKVVGWWCLLFGPLIALAACRPGHDGGPCLWEKSDYTEKEHE